MNYQEIWQEFLKLSPDQRANFVDAARQHRKFENQMLNTGTPVEWKHSKNGITYAGIFVKMRRKYAEVMAPFDRDGRRLPNPVLWSVAPEMLRPVAKEENVG